MVQDEYSDSDVALSGTRIGGVLTIRGRGFLAAGLTLLAGGLFLGFIDIARVGVLLSALPLLAGLRARRSNNNLRVTRSVHPARLAVDQNARVAIVLQNASDRRTPLQFAEEQVDCLLRNRPRFVLPAMEPEDMREVDYEICCQVRGRYRLGPLTVRKGDPYGLTAITTSLPGFTDVLVLPRIEVLGRRHSAANGIGAEGTTPHMVAMHGEDDVAVRNYRNGDDLRRIHWPATAHRSELMVRQEDHPARRRAVIVLDSRESGHQGSGAMGSFEWAVTATASVAAYLTEHHYTLHLASNETTTEGLATHAVEIDDVLTTLALARLGASQQFDEVLRWARPLTLSGGLVVAIVTDHDQDTLRRTAALRQPEGTGLMILLDTASFAQQPGPPTEHTLAMADMVSAAGWSTCVVGAGMTVEQAWSIISARSSVRVGARR
jgi:uncharacterized protein (DUF58 family)